MKIETDDYRVHEGKDADLKNRPTQVKPLCDSKEAYKDCLADQVMAISDLQDLLYASNQHSLLVIFQAMDAAGKDSTIKHVFSGVNPQGIHVHSFKQPSAEELEHDFLWRAQCRLPERGHVGVFNRSYYEEVLVVRVHPALLLKQNLPQGIASSEKLWQRRFDSICDFEKHLAHNGTKTIKIYLHLSPEEQRKRFLARIDEPKKNWKFSAADVTEREYWKDYRVAYEAAISATSTKESPWYVIPADRKADTRLIVAKIVHDTLKGLPMSYPVPDEAHLKTLQSCRNALVE